jgi:hypothetical protein
MNREHIILMADASGLSLYGMGKDRDQFIDYLERFANLVASAEREACAEVCKKHADVYALLEQNPHASGAGKLAWAACIDNRDTILARGQV